MDQDQTATLKGNLQTDPPHIVPLRKQSDLGQHCLVIIVFSRFMDEFTLIIG